MPVQKLQAIDTFSPAGIAAVLYNMRMQSQEVEVVEMDGDIYIKIPNNEVTEETRAALKDMQGHMNKVTFEDALECCNRDNSATASASKEYVKQNIEKYKAYLSGKLPHEKLSPADELQANLIADTEWFMRNQILMEYITELFQKNYKR